MASAILEGDVTNGHHLHKVENKVFPQAFRLDHSGQCHLFALWLTCWLSRLVVYMLFWFYVIFNCVQPNEVNAVLTKRTEQNITISIKIFRVLFYPLCSTHSRHLPAMFWLWRTNGAGIDRHDDRWQCCCQYTVVVGTSQVTSVHQGLTTVCFTRTWE